MEVPTRDEIAAPDRLVTYPVRLGVLVVADRAFRAGDIEGARTAWERNAERSPACACNAAVLYCLTGRGPDGVDRALQLLTSAAERDATAMTNLAGLLLRHRGDAEASARWLERALAAGDVLARCGAVSGATPEAAAGGHPVVVNLRGCLAYARGDLALAGSEFARAAASGYPPALYRLGGCHLRGDGRRYDVAAGRALVTRAAAAGYGHAQRLLARCHLAGTAGYALDAERGLAYLGACRSEWESVDADAHDTLMDRMPLARLVAAQRLGGALELQALYGGAAWYMTAARPAWRRWLGAMLGVA